MNCIVCVKQVIDSTQSIKLTKEGSLYDEGMAYILNEWDNYALEEALLIKERSGGSVTAITVAPNRADAILKDCVAKGADKAVRIWDEAIEGSDYYALAKVLREVIMKMPYDLILVGMQAEDDGYALVDATIAQMLGIQHATAVTSIQLEEGKAKVHRELEEGLEEVLEVDLPAVFTVQTGINSPRYPSLKGIKRAMGQGVALMSLEDLDLSASEVGEPGSRTTVEEIYVPTVERLAEVLEGGPDQTVGKLLDILEEKGLI
jgi:electron transfer flavoprotein beta subunit